MIKNTLIGFVVLAFMLTSFSIFGQSPEANPRCSDFGYSHSIKVDSAPFATSVVIPSIGTITTSTPNNFTVNWQSTAPPTFVRAIIVKGGADATVKHYPVGTWFDNGIVTPVNASGGNAAISHIEFCYILAPSAAPVTLSGRVLDRYKRGISNAAVRATDINGLSKVSYTNTFGYYKLELMAGEGYVIDVTQRRYIFGAQFISLQDNLSGFDIVAQ